MEREDRQGSASAKVHSLMQSMETLETAIGVDPKRQSAIVSSSPELSLVLHLEFFILLCLHFLVLLQLKQR